jgi:hypothetical protein
MEQIETNFVLAGCTHPPLPRNAEFARISGILWKIVRNRIFPARVLTNTFRRVTMMPD